jgi:Tfp pilus assembly protein PilX
MRGHRPEIQKQQGVALVTTVIVVAVLAVVAVAFMQSTTVDRLSSRSVANYARAKLAAEAGAAVAQATLVDLLTRYPDSVTGWQNIGGGAVAGTANEATVLYMRARANDTNRGASPADSGASVVLLGQPLVSRGTNTQSNLPSTSVSTNPLALSNLLSAMVFVATNTNMVNINATSSIAPIPFVGRRPATNTNTTQTLLPVTAAQWIYLTNASGETNARYAYWVEDESFKANINIVTNGARGSGLGLATSEGRLEGAWRSYSNSILSVANAASAISGRTSSGFPTALTAAFAAGISADKATAAEELQFLTTVHSAGLDLSRGGFKRVNINSIALGTAGGADTDAIRTNLNRFIVSVTNSNSSPRFGQRFYRLGTGSTAVNASNAVSAQHEGIYLQKIAANVLDFLDVDNQPTLIAADTSNSIITGRPVYAIEPVGGGNQGANPVAAIGQETVPRLQEYAIHARLLTMNPVGYRTNSPPPALEADFEFTVDHYFEFWNPTSRDISALDLDRPFLKIHGQPQMGVNVEPPIVEGRDFELPIPTNVIFPAGGILVLTTAPKAEQNQTLLAGNTNVVSLTEANGIGADQDGFRRFKGKTKDETNNTTGFGGFNRLFHITMQSGALAGRAGTATTDYETAILLGNERGHLESFVGLPIAHGNTSPAFSLRVTNGAMLGGSDLYFVRGGSLRGNSSVGPSSTEGDPRALNEQLEYLLFLPSSQGGNNSPEQTRFYTSGLEDGKVPADSSIGQPNTKYVAASNWVDFSSLSAGSANAPLTIRNEPIHSIGELGHLTDPARVPGTAGNLTNVVYSRGGGRTLRIGQPEHPRWHDTNQTSASRTWTSWRLADIFTTTAPSNNTTSRNPDGVLTNAQGVVRGRTNAAGVVVSIPGLLNPNGALRDNGAALRAALYGMTMLPSPTGAQNTSGRAVNVSNVVGALTTRLTTAAGAGLPTGALNPLWERGEISELALFNTNETLLGSGVRMREAFDRGREEVVRRSIEMFTTRGSIFTVYVVGQCLQGTNITSSARMKQTFEVEPQFASTQNAASGVPQYADDRFDPSQQAAVASRFAAPTNYTLRVLSSTYD